jgi:F0F1-type ATP synthase membrane subunit b/b'
MSSMQMDLSVVVIVILVWSLYFVLKTFFFDPINHILSKRHAAIEGTQQQAKEQLTEVDKQSKVYAKAIKEARLESYRKQEVLRAEAMSERSQVIAAGREDAEHHIGGARKVIQSQVDTAKKVLESQVNEIADGIAKSVLQ